MTTRTRNARPLGAPRFIMTITLALSLAACVGQAGMNGSDDIDAGNSAADLDRSAADGPAATLDLEPSADMEPGPVLDGALIACFGKGEECTGGGECCSKMCASSICTPPLGMCAQTSQACKGSEDCCSGNCGNGLCTQPIGICQSIGEACAGPTNCCTGRCTKNVCTLGGLLACRALDAMCQADSDCCSENCSRGVCVEPVGQCNAPATRCTKASQCCGGACTNGACGNTVRCSALGAPCTESYQCCSDYCDPNKKCAPRRAM